jgi:hypothetical protein
MKMLFLALLGAASLAAQQDDAPLMKLEFLLGKWVGVAEARDTPQGAGRGAFSFTPELNRKIVVRRNEARYQSGAAHDDLMVIYLENGPKAIYFDSEGHTIHYTLSFPGPDSVVFEGGMYRLSYWMEKGELRGKFEVGGKPYMQWTSRR